MAQRFVIDININGAQGSGRSGRGGPDNSFGTAVLGVGVARNLSEIQKKGLSAISERAKLIEGLQEKHKGPGAVYVPEESRIIKQGFFKTTWGVPLLREKTNIDGTPTATISEARTKTNTGWIQENQKQVKAAAVALAWKTAQTTVDLQNYKSGDSYANDQRNNNMKIASYAAAIAATGFNPFVIAGIVINEGVNAITDGIKYRYDRKVEGEYIDNIKSVAGNISYGRNRGGV